jgi:hypothetical protein
MMRGRIANGLMMTTPLGATGAVAEEVLARIESAARGQ